MLKTLYKDLSTDREPYLERARRCAALTQPSLYPMQGHGPWSDLPDPFQSTGSMGIESLASKILLALFPPGVPFFRLTLTAEARARLAGAEAEVRVQVERTLADSERILAETVETPLFRVRVLEALKHLLVSGNVLLWYRGERWMVVPLTNFVVNRDNADQLLELVVEESVDPRTQPESVRALLDHSDTHTLHTGWTRVGPSKFETWQEVDGHEVPDSRRTIKDLPFVLPRWEAISGESYARSYVEKVLGDLASLESLSEATILLATEAARIIPMVDPAGTTDINDLSRAHNGKYVWGRPADVGFLHLDKIQDLQAATALAAEVRQSLRQAFFMGDTVQRSGERVTAHEISYLASQLDTALGGGFSVLAEELQVPLLAHALRRAKKDLPELPEDLVTPKIVTGLEGLGRGRDMQALIQWLGTLQAIPPNELSALVNWHGVVESAARLSNVDVGTVLRTPEEAAQIRQQQQQQALAQQVAPEVARAVGRSVQPNT